MKQPRFVRQVFSYETLLASSVSGFRIIVMGVITVKFSRAQIIAVTLPVPLYYYVLQGGHLDILTISSAW